MNPRLGYAMVILDGWQNTCQRGVTGYRRYWGTICSEWIDCIELRTRLNDFEMFICVYNDELGFILMKRPLKNVLDKSFKTTMYK